MKTKPYTDPYAIMQRDASYVALIPPLDLHKGSSSSIEVYRAFAIARHRLRTY